MATEKQKKLAKKMSENIRNRPMGAILLEAGYSEAVSKKPKLATEGKGFIDYYDKHFNDEKVTAKHNVLLTAKKFITFTFPYEMEDEEIKDFLKDMATDIRIKTITKVNQKSHYEWKEKIALCKTDNLNTIKEAVDMAYKIKGKYKETIVNEDTDPYKNLSDDEILAKLDEYRKNDRYSKYDPNKPK